MTLRELLLKLLTFYMYKEKNVFNVICFSDISRNYCSLLLFFDAKIFIFTLQIKSINRSPKNNHKFSRKKADKRINL